jgi:hypothetical protein
MRRCCSLSVCMLAVSMGLILPSEAQAQGSSTPSGPVAKKTAAKKPEAGPNAHAVAAAPSCAGGELVALHQLAAKDVETLKGALAAQFQFNCLRFSVVKDQNKICVTLPKDRPACTIDIARQAISVAEEFDRPAFSGQVAWAAYLVSLPRIGAETIAKYFAESNPDLSLQPASPFLVIVPKVAVSAEIKDAAEKLKHDFEAIDRIYPQGLTPKLTGGASCLEPKEIMALTALVNMTGQPRITAEVGRGASLTITPVSLDGASSAALDVDFNVSEESAPQSTESTPRKDLLNRVAEHKVNSHVRVESLKLFSISSFTMELQHPERGQPFPSSARCGRLCSDRLPTLASSFTFRTIWPRWTTAALLLFGRWLCLPPRISAWGCGWRVIGSLIPPRVPPSAWIPWLKWKESRACSTENSCSASRKLKPQIVSET